MDDEFALCWNNFQDNIAVGFQNLYDRGDLVDVTLACDGKLLQAHKIVLAICSPYFQEMFISNPCKHPIIVLKDVGYSVMSELLQFMYQGVVNVKHTELSSFMKIAQTLQIKGLTTSSSTQKSPSQNQNASSNYSKNSNNSNNNENQTNNTSSGNVIETKINSSSFSHNNKTTENATSSSSSLSTTSGGIKRTNDYQNSDPLSIYPKRLHKQRTSDPSEHDINNDSMDHMSADDVFLPPIPQISMIEPRFDLNNVKREIGDPPASPGGVRNSIPPSFNFDHNIYSNKPIEYPNELHMSNDYPKGAGNHMDIPPGSSITMLSSTSLLHGNCIFNRNNTVATQQGMKTYWLCKSYRITMCRARCITHQGRVISATGVHNHQPHIKPPNGNDFLGPIVNTTSSGGMNGANIMGNNSSNSLNVSSSMRLGQNSHHQQQQQLQQQQQHHQLPHISSHQQIQSAHQQLHHTNNMQGHQQHSANNAAVIQNMMQNVLSQNNLMHLTNMAPMLNSLPHQHSVQLNNIIAPSSLEITPILNSSSNVNNSPASRGSNHQMDSPVIHSSTIESPSRNNSGNNVPVVSSSSVISISTSSPADENCNSVSQDSSNSSQSNIISTITISPTQPSFKMEHI